MQTPPRVAVVVGSTRPTRIGPDIAGWVRATLDRRSRVRYEIVDLAAIALPLLDEPEKAATGHYEHGHTRAWSELVSSYDGFVFVLPQYNWGYPGVLKNALDFLYAEWRDKPASFLTYGARGGNRAAAQFGVVLQGLHMRVLDTHVEAVIAAGDVDGAAQLVDVDTTLAPCLDALAALDEEMSRALLEPAEAPVLRVAVVGLGGIGRAIAGRLLDAGHEVSVWNRTAARRDELTARGARPLEDPDEAGDSDAVVLCLADDASLLAVAAPDGAARAAWRDATVVSTSTVAPGTVTRLAELYGTRFVAAFVLGAPQAVAAGTARWIVGGAPQPRQVLAPLWETQAAVLEAGDSPARAAAVKLLQNQMLLTGLAVVTETVRLGRAAGLDDEELRRLLTSSPMVAPGLANRIDVLLSTDHAGWFTGSLAAKDLEHALDLDPAGGHHALTEAARDGYAHLPAQGWGDADVAALVELAAPGRP